MCAFVPTLGTTAFALTSTPRTALTTRRPQRLVAARPSLHMSVKRSEMPALGALPALAWPAAAALATDATGEPLGVDDSRLLAVMVILFAGVFTLFIGWASRQDDSDDFIGEYDPRRK